MVTLPREQHDHPVALVAAFLFLLWIAWMEWGYFHAGSAPAPLKSNDTEKTETVVASEVPAPAEDPHTTSGYSASDRETIAKLTQVPENTQPLTKQEKATVDRLLGAKRK